MTMDLTSLEMQEFEQRLLTRFRRELFAELDRKLTTMANSTSGQMLLNRGLLLLPLGSAARTETDGVPLGLLDAYDDGSNVYIGSFGSNGWQYVQLS